MAGRRTRDRRVALAALAAAAGMLGAAYGAVPLYEAFCRATGYGGTPRTAEAAPGPVLARRVDVRFDAGVGPELPWRFAPERRAIQVRVGERALAFYRARNLSGEAVSGTATFNVTPAKAGPYFAKIACFCFAEQRLAAGASARMPVSFFVDPAIADDPGLDDVTTITLSYTFFRTEPGAGRAGRGGAAGKRADG